MREKRKVHLIVGNHNTFDGIYDIAHIINGVLSNHYEVVVSYGISLNGINVLIDEFSSTTLASYLKQVKRDYPDTKLVVVATEFVTRVTFLGIPLGLSFNLPSSIRNLWTNAVGHYWALVVPGMYPYMHSRFVGFREIVKTADLVVSIAPSVARSLVLLDPKQAGRKIPRTILYPEVKLDQALVSNSLKNIPFGFVLTGTLTKYRRSLINQINKAFRNYRLNVCKATGFSNSQPSASRTAEFAYPYKRPDVLFNLNPPQERLWKWSSPVRIYRAAILGQVPVLTKVFGDHEIEKIAATWRGIEKDTQRLFLHGTLGRDDFVDAFLGAVTDYNEIAKNKNQTFLEYFERFANPEESEMK